VIKEMHDSRKWAVPNGDGIDWNRMTGNADNLSTTYAEIRDFVLNDRSYSKGHVDRALDQDWVYDHVKMHGDEWESGWSISDTYGKVIRLGDWAEESTYPGSEPDSTPDAEVQEPIVPSVTPLDHAG
jgi:hypothetical protein